MSDLSILAEAILSGDHSEIYGALEPYLTSRDHKALAAAIDICPHHGCDEQICYDDRALCVDRRTVLYGSLDEDAKHILEEVKPRSPVELANSQPGETK